MKLQQFVVTGSNIRRLDLEKIAPVTVIDQTPLEVCRRDLPVALSA